MLKHTLFVIVDFAGITPSGEVELVMEQRKKENRSDSQSVTTPLVMSEHWSTIYQINAVLSIWKLEYV